MHHPRECFTGWDDLIDELERHLTYLSPDYEVHQVKEKFGGLRYYASYVPRVTDSDEERAVAKQIFHRLIDETERRSYHHCERCGERGKLRTSLLWHKTLCDTHYDAECTDDTKEPVEDLLTFFADLMDQGTVHVDLSPSLLREASSTITDLRTDVIEIRGKDDVITTIEGQEATELIENAVTEYVNTALRNLIEETEDDV